MTSTEAVRFRQAVLAPEGRMIENQGAAVDTPNSTTHFWFGAPRSSSLRNSGHTPQPLERAQVEPIIVELFPAKDIVPTSISGMTIGDEDRNAGIHQRVFCQ